jgi:hypothetical protein
MKQLNLPIMKSTIITLLFCILAQFSMASEQKQLPEEPWKAIAEMTKYYSNNRW